MNKTKTHLTNNCIKRIKYGAQNSAINRQISIEEINVSVGRGIYKVESIVR